MQTDWLERLKEAAVDSTRVRGLTHSFYRYPARFSPQFAATAIELFSKPGELVLDPFMGGGTTVVEAYALGRRAYGVDLNELAAFVTKAKLTALGDREVEELGEWLQDSVASFDYSTRPTQKQSSLSPYLRNLSGPETRPIKKLTQFCINRLDELPSARARVFARCVLLRTAQWAFDGRRETPSLTEFRYKLLIFAEEMLCAMIELKALVSTHESPTPRPRIACARAEHLATLPLFRSGEKAALAVTSPPYPGVHVLYHRWQVLGRRETPAPYWISNSNDGQGASFYNFGDRHDPEQANYFKSYGASLSAIRDALRPGGILVQMVACRNPSAHLGRLSIEVQRAGFEPLNDTYCDNLIARTVPGRKWHASLKGDIPAAREFVLVHRRM